MQVGGMWIPVMPPNMSILSRDGIEVAVCALEPQLYADSLHLCKLP